MKFQWRQAGGPTPASASPQHSATECACRSMGEVLEKLSRIDKPEILDISPFCGDTAVYLASRGARVTVEEFVPPVAPAASNDAGASEEDVTGPPIRIDQEDGRFHLVFLGDMLDFIPAKRLPEFGSELWRVMADGAWLIAFARNSNADEPQGRTPGRYRLIADDKLTVEPSGGAIRRAWNHPTRQIESALAPLSIQGIHLLRNQLREFLALKRGGGRKAPRRL